jgi:hypothetical protein
MAPPHPEVVRERQRLKAMDFRGNLFTPEITIFSRNKLLVICYQRRRIEIRAAFRPPFPPGATACPLVPMFMAVTRQFCRGSGDASALTICYSLTTKYSTVVFALT